MPAARILIIDTYYDSFLKSWNFNPEASYEAERDRLLRFSFGTFDAYSRNLRELGWEVDDWIANAFPPENLADIPTPDIVFMQNLSLNPPTYKAYTLLAGQLSCPWPGDEKVRKYDAIFTSFPHFIERIERLGVRAVFNPLAFDPIVLRRANSCPHCYGRGSFLMAVDYEGYVQGSRCALCDGSGIGKDLERIHDCVFIGGVGAPSHWAEGMKTLEMVAREIPAFKWWGYGIETLPASSALHRCYQGQAWGLDMYRIFLQSKIVLNRHGDVTQDRDKFGDTANYSNNMRMFEATGCSALLLTETSANLFDYFHASEALCYNSPGEACHLIRHYLAHDDKRQAIATRGQARTLADHTYAIRMKIVSDTLQAMLCPA